MNLSLSAAQWWALFGQFCVLSLLSFGGAMTVAPDMHRSLVTQMGLLTNTQFNASIAIAQAAPGPNVLFVAVLGYQAAGWSGLAATTLGILLPSTTVSWFASRWMQRRAHWRAIQAFKAGLAPIVVGLLFSIGWILATHASHWAHVLLTALTALLVWKTRVPMLLLLAVGAGVGVAVN